MMYLPFKKGQPEHQLFLDTFGLVLPEKVADAVIKRDVKLTFDHDREFVLMSSRKGGRLDY